MAPASPGARLRSLQLALRRLQLADHHLPPDRREALLAELSDLEVCLTRLHLRLVAGVEGSIERDELVACEQWLDRLTRSWSAAAPVVVDAFGEGSIDLGSDDGPVGVGVA